MRAPTLSSDEILNMAEVGLKLISDAEMYLSFKEGMRGDAFYILKMYSQANNKY